MEPIKETILGVMRGLSSQKTVRPQDDPTVFLKKALTKNEFKHIKVQYFRKGVLGLSVDSSSWLYSLNLKKEALLSKLSSKNKDIKAIRFFMGDAQ